MIEIVVATRNQGKLREIEQALSGLEVKLLSLNDCPDAPEVVEDGDTFVQNAEKKARAVAQHTGKYALADDSGLCVDALDGAPGVHSARYAGEGATDEMNNQKLLGELEKTPDAKRTARFVCIMVLASPEGETYAREGSCKGEILTAPRGQKGFGYDPLFFYPPLKATFAEISGDEKLKVSHRGAALRELKKVLAAELGV
jgi:XTP/dITP diphosphohydrolase